MQPLPLLDSIEDLLIFPALLKAQSNTYIVQMNSSLDYPSYTLKQGIDITSFSTLIPEPGEHFRLVNLISGQNFLKNKQYWWQTTIKKSLPRTLLSEKVNETYWCPSHRNPDNDGDHTPIQTRNLNELHDSEKLEKLNPKDNPESQAKCLCSFGWIGMTTALDPKKTVGTLNVEFHIFFARQRSFVGITTKY